MPVWNKKKRVLNSCGRYAYAYSYARSPIEERLSASGNPKILDKSKAVRIPIVTCSIDPSQRRKHSFNR